jgi:L-threonylcarbamoyladenylate synthase
MKTAILKISDPEKQSDMIDYAAKLLQEGQVVAFPTETVYGLGAIVSDEGAIKKIFKAKSRPADNPLIVHISKESQLKEVARKLPKKAKLLIKEFWPGPLSIVLPKHASLPNIVTGGLDTVVVRFPSHPIAQSLIKAVGEPVAAPSANTSGRVSPTKAEHVLEDLDGKIPLIIDSGEIEYGLESTVVDCTTKDTIILRPGSITIEMIKKIIPSIRVHETGDKQSSPGMKYRHYATDAQIILFRGETNNTSRAIKKYLAENNCKNSVLLWHSGNFPERSTNHRLPANSYEAGPLIFETLRESDKKETREILIQGFSEEGIGQAIMNRLEKAASEIVDV